MPTTEARMYNLIEQFRAAGGDPAQAEEWFKDKIAQRLWADYRDIPIDYLMPDSQRYRFYMRSPYDLEAHRVRVARCTPPNKRRNNAPTNLSWIDLPLRDTAKGRLLLGWLIVSNVGVILLLLLSLFFRK